MERFLINTLVDTLAVLVCAYLLPGVSVDSFAYAILVALALALLNQFVRPLLFILTIPATILTFGLFFWVIDAMMIMLADWIVTGFHVESFWWALGFSLVLTIVKSIFNSLRGKDKRSQGDE